MYPKQALPVLVASVVWIVAGCRSGQTTGTTAPMTLDAFSCQDRRAAYVMADGTGSELGVAIDCAVVGPRVHTWVVAVGNDNRGSAEYSLTPDEFEAVWDKLHSTRWRGLTNCDSSTASEGDPMYTISIQDHAASTSLTCLGAILPAPYATIIDELNLLISDRGR